MSVLPKNIEGYTTWLNESQSDEKYAHITDEERQKCHTTCDETSSWLYEMLDKQGLLAPTQDPIVTVAQIQTKSNLVATTCSPIKHKMAPKPKKEEKKEEEKAAPAAEPEEKKAGDESGPMDTEPTDEAKPEGAAGPMDVEKTAD